MTKLFANSTSALLIVLLASSGQATPLASGAAAVLAEKTAETPAESLAAVVDPEDGLAMDGSVHQIAEQLADSQETLPDVLSPSQLAEYIQNPTNQIAWVEDAMSGLFQRASYGGMHLVVDTSVRTKRTRHGQTLRIIRDGLPTITWNVSTARNIMETPKDGAPYFSETPTGEFQITRRVKDYVSKSWKAPMPYAQFFVESRGIAFHATTGSHYGELGTRASGGCVRLTLANAAKLWKMVEDEGVGSVTVTVVNCSKTPAHQFCN